MDRRTPRLMAAGAIGNLLEWYDFAVYGYFAAAIGRAFFPEQDKVAQVLAAFGIFAVGFMMRPVGGALFGHVGDRFGRSIAATDRVSAAERPMRSPTWPKIAPPIGRIMNPTANTPKAASTWATLSCSGKKARPIAAAK